MKIYIDSIKIGKQDFTAGMPTYTENLHIGSDHNSSQHFNGISDEVRISNIARSFSWIKATYHSSRNTLLTYGGEKQRPFYYFSGHTFEQQSPVSRKLYLYERSTGDLVDTTTSSGDGYYYMETASSGSHNIVCLDDEAGVDYNDLISGKVFPTTISG